jgi:hypothetical protein
VPDLEQYGECSRQVPCRRTTSPASVPSDTACFSTNRAALGRPVQFRAVASPAEEVTDEAGIEDDTDLQYALNLGDRAVTGLGLA